MQARHGFPGGAEILLFNELPCCRQYECCRDQLDGVSDQEGDQPCRHCLAETSKHNRQPGYSTCIDNDRSNKEGDDGSAQASFQSAFCQQSNHVSRDHEPDEIAARRADDDIQSMCAAGEEGSTDDSHREIGG